MLVFLLAVASGAVGCLAALAAKAVGHVRSTSMFILCAISFGLIPTNSHDQDSALSAAISLGAYVALNVLMWALMTKALALSSSAVQPFLFSTCSNILFSASLDLDILLPFRVSLVIFSLESVLVLSGFAA